MFRYFIYSPIRKKKMFKNLLTNTFILVNDIEFRLNNRGNLSLVHKGHQFTRIKSGRNSVYWICSQYHKSKCSFYITQYNDNGTFQIGKQGTHNHEIKTFGRQNSRKK